MSRDVARAYKQFLNMEKKRSSKVDNSLSAASGGLLSPRMPMNKKKNKEEDQFDSMIRIVNEIRKYGGSAQ